VGRLKREDHELLLTSVVPPRRGRRRPAILISAYLVCDLILMSTASSARPALRIRSLVMRFVNVVGVMSLGIGLGTAAVLAPLWLTSTGVAPTGAASTGAAASGSAGLWVDRAGQFVRDVAGSVTGSFTDLTSPASNGRPSPDQAAATTRDRVGTLGETPAHAQSPSNSTASGTIGYLARAPGTAAAKIAEPTAVQQPWTTQVTVEPETASGRKQTSSKPTSEDQRRTLVHDIQTELKRVGCYDGEPDGTWSAASKRAMASFTERVNASLPFEQPDFILLTLVQGHAGKACGKPCANGQTLSDGGRCLTSNVLAQADRTKDKFRGERADRPAKTAELPTVVRPSVGSAWTATVTGPVTTGSIATAVPAPAQRPTVKRGTDVANSTTTPAPPVSVRETVLPSPQIADRALAPLPGRMTIGGPAVAPSPQLTQEPTAAIPVRPGVPKAEPTKSQLATLDVAKPTAQVPTPVTETDVDDPPPQRAARPGNATVRAPVAARPRQDAPAPTVVHRPAPQRAVSSAPPKEPQFGSKQRRLVYEMFQRPDRN
jgi:hypothetical protein